MHITTHIFPYASNISRLLLIPMLGCFSHVQLFATLWTVAHEAPLSLGLSKQEYWSGLPCPPPKDLPDPEIKPMSPAFLHSLPTEPPGKPSYVNSCWCMGKKIRTFWNLFSFFSVVHWIHKCRTYRYWRMTLIVAFFICESKVRLQTMLCLKKAQEGTIGCTLIEQNFSGPCCTWCNQTSLNTHMLHPEPKSVLPSSLGMRCCRIYRIFIEIIIF